MIDCPLNRLKVKRGEDVKHSKLTEPDVILIRAIVAERDELRRQASLITNRKLAEKFNVHHRTIDKITAGESWTHL